MASERQRSVSEKRGRNVPPRSEMTPRARRTATATSATPRGSSRTRVPSQQRSLLAAAGLRSTSAGSRTPQTRTPRSSLHSCNNAVGSTSSPTSNQSFPSRQAVRVQAVPSSVQPSSPSAPSARSSAVSVTARATGGHARTPRRSSSLEQQVSYNQQIAFRKQRSDESVRVAVRFRPLWADEESQGVAFTVRPDRRIVESVDLTYSFELDWAFGAEVLQSQVYSLVGHPVVSDVLNGYNGTVLAYGQTGSGKTYCMFGPHIEQPGSQGLMPRTARQIFDAIRGAPDDIRFVLRCSLLEIYCEQLRDLLDPSNQRPLRIQEHPKKGIFVDNLTQECVTCEEDVLDILQMGTEMRKLAATRLNKLSSRSHVLFFVTCEQKYPDGTEKVGKLSLVDLAGSERVGKSGALSAGGVRLQEAKSINCSLTALGYIIQALAEKQAHVPYRNSQLTRVLQETIGGNCKTTLLVACSACTRHLSETLSSLRFATRARSVRNHVKVNLIHSAEQLERYVRQLQRELLSERREATRLGAAITKHVSLAFPEEDEDAAPGAGIGSDTIGNVALVNGDSAALSSNSHRESFNATLQSSVSSEEHGPSSQELAIEYAAIQLFEEIDKIVTSLGVQDDQIRSLWEAKLRCGPAGDELDPESELLRWRAKRSGLEWRFAALQHFAMVIEADAAAEDAGADRHLTELADMWEQVRVQRLNLRRQEAQSISTSSTPLSDSILNGTEVGLDSMLTGGSGLDISGVWPPWASRARCLQRMRRGSKVLRPISRRSIERQGNGAASCHSSSCCSTPREAVSLLSPRRLEDAEDAVDEVHANPAANLLDLRPPGMAHGDLEEAMSSPENDRSTVIGGPANSAEDAATTSTCRQQASNSGRATGGMAVAGRAHDCKPGRIVAHPVGHMNGEHTAADEVQRLKAEIKQVRAEQDTILRNFESSRARIIEECWAERILDHIRVLEEEHVNMQGEIPHLQSKLEQADLALEELELVGDASELEILRLECQLERQKRKLNRTWEPLEEIQTKPFKLALGRVVNTITLQRMRSLSGRASERSADTMCNSPKPGEKENRPPDTYAQSPIRRPVLAPSSHEVTAPRGGQLAATALQGPGCTAAQWRSPQRLYS